MLTTSEKMAVNHTVPTGAEIIACHRGIDLCAARVNGAENVYFNGVEYKTDFAVQIVIDICRTSWKSRKVIEYLKRNCI